MPQIKIVVKVLRLLDHRNVKAKPHQRISFEGLFTSVMDNIELELFPSSHNCINHT